MFTLHSLHLVCGFTFTHIYYAFEGHLLHICSVFYSIFLIFIITELHLHVFGVVWKHFGKLYCEKMQYYVPFKHKWKHWYYVNWTWIKNRTSSSAPNGAFPLYHWCRLLGSRSNNLKTHWKHCRHIPMTWQ